MMKMMRGKKYAGRRSVRFLAAAALTAALLSGQAVYPAFAQSEELEWDVLSVIPENITIDQPVSLEEIALPEIEYGVLAWADPSYVPSQRVESCEIILTPGESADLSWMEGWDEEEGVWRGYVTVVVTSLEEPEENYSDTEADEVLSQNESMNTETGDDEAAGKDETDPEQEEGADPGNGEAYGEQQPAENGTEPQTTDISGENTQEGQEQPSGEINGNVPDAANDENGGEDSGTAANQDTASQEPAGSGSPDQDNASDQNGVQDSVQDSNQDSVQDSNQDSVQDSNQDSVQDNNQESGDTETPAGDGDTQTEEPDAGGLPETPDDQTGGENAEEGTPQEPDNIFDRTEDSTDDRPLTVENDLTEEEQLARAAENHTCDGIFVSGIRLPWYVQFRASSGETYEFSNEKTASIFKSYEFELWDLKNECEYVIPEGEYVSVTVPVKEGYDYTVEHILDNGAVETIIPSVDGNIMVFSTHSFSPFGIAGSKPVVGDDVTDKNYPSTPTPAPTKKPGTTAAPTPTPGSIGGNGNNGVDKDNSGYTGNGNSPADKDNSGSAGNGNSTADKDNAGYTENTGSDNTVDKDNAGYVNDESSDDESGSSASRAVATGDNTLIYPFVVLLAADFMLIAAVIAAKKRKVR